MDFTPISVRHMLVAFGLTVVIGLLPVLAVVLSGTAFSVGGGYSGLVLGLGTVAVMAALIGLSWLAVALGRRVVGRPSRA